MRSALLIVLAPAAVLVAAAVWYGVFADARALGWPGVLLMLVVPAVVLALLAWERSDAWLWRLRACVSRRT